MLKSVVIEAMYRLRCWRVTERFNSPYCTRDEIGGTPFRSAGAIMTARAACLLHRSNSDEPGRSDRFGLDFEQRLWNSGRLWAFVF